jgi:WD40 repeat protein
MSDNNKKIIKPTKRTETHHENPYQYDAFISYSWKNQTFAKQLEASLERYRLPKSLAVGKDRLNIYRDVQDQVGNDLSEAIRKGLQDSHYLVVICSPEARQSFWVGKEIEEFANLHSKENIIPVIHSGRPNKEIHEDDLKQDQAFHDSLYKYFDDPIGPDFRLFEKDGYFAARERKLEAKFQLIAHLVGQPKESLINRQRRHTIQLLSIAVAIFSVVALAFAWIAWIASQNAEKATAQTKLAAERLRIATATNLAFIGNDTLAADKTVAIRIAQAAYALDSENPRLSVLRLLHKAFYEKSKERFYRKKIEHNQDFDSAPTIYTSFWAEFSPDDSMILTMPPSSNKHLSNARLWSMDGRLIRELSDPVAFFSPAGGLLVTMPFDSTVKLWNLKGDLLQVFPHYTSSPPALSQDGALILTAPNATLYALYAIDGRLIQKFPTNEVRAVSTTGGSPIAMFSVDCKSLLFAKDDNTLLLLDINGNSLATFRHESSVQNPSFSPNAQLLMISSLDSIIVPKFSNHDSVVSALKEDNPYWFLNTVLMDGGSMALQAAIHDVYKDFPNYSSAKLWTLDGQLLPLRFTHEHHIRSALFSPDGKTILTAGDDRKAKLWTIDGDLLVTFPHEWPVWSALFSNKGNLLLTTSGWKATLWNLAGDLIEYYPHRGLTHASFAHGGDHVVTIAHDNTAKVWDVTGDIFRTINQQFGVESASFSNDERYIYTVSERDSTFKVFSVSGDSITTIRNLGFMDNKQLVISPDYNTFLVRPSARKLQIHSAEGDSLTTIEFRNFLYDVAYSPTGSRFLVTMDTALVNIYSRTGDLINQLNLLDNKFVSSARFSSSGNYVLVAQDSTATLWSVNGDCLNTFHHDHSIRSTAFATDDTRIVTESLGLTMIWSLDGQLQTTIASDLNSFVFSQEMFTTMILPDGKRMINPTRFGVRLNWINGDSIAQLDHTDLAKTVRFSSNQNQILTASDDGTAKLWTLEGRLLAVFRHTGAVFSASFSPDDKYILTASRDGTAKLWDLQGNTIATYRFDSLALNSAAFSPSGNMILTATNNGYVKVWLTPKGIYEWLKKAPIYQLSEKEQLQYGIKF